ncbi:MAG: D-amino-acid oxidase [Hyphomicrobiales bacterium]|nr:MAG: D-amino-acid oxidase [Hyphomicrobiales bacterium]
MPILDPVTSSEKLPSSVDVAIVGGGIVGAAAAYYLARAGVPVALFEKGEIGGEQSSRNWGFVRSQGRDPREIPLMLASLDLWRGLNAEIGMETGFRQSGILYLADTDAKLAEFEAWLKVGKGFPIETRLLGAKEAADLIPGATQRFAGGLYTPSDGRAEPSMAAPALARAAQANGGGVFTNCAVRGVETSAGRVSGVVTEKGTVKASTVVVAGGAWSSLFVRRLGLRLPQLKVLGSVMRTAPLPEVYGGGVWGPGFSFRRRLDGGYSLAPSHAELVEIVPDSFRFFFDFLPGLKSEIGSMHLRLRGSFLKELGWTLSGGTDRPGPYEAVRTYDPAPEAAWLKSLAEKLARAHPAFKEMQIVERWAGGIDVTPDAVPVIGPVDSIPGLILATGFSGHGFGIGPGAGHLVADIARGATPLVDPAPFSWTRFIDGSKLAPFAAV